MTAVPEYNSNGVVFFFIKITTRELIFQRDTQNHKLYILVRLKTGTKVALASVLKVQILRKIFSSSWYYQLVLKNKTLVPVVNTS